MGRRRRGGRHGGRRGFKIPILTLAILGGQALVANAAGPKWEDKLNTFQRFYTGFNLQGSSGGFTFGAFDPTYLGFGYGPWLVKGLVMKIARPLGAVPRVPFGLPISIS